MKQLQSLQIYRGLAAVAVVVHHAVLSTEAFVGKLPILLADILNFGLLGVDFFFVLSGFIIMHAHCEDRRSGAALGRYAFKRLTRVYPAYLPIGIAVLVLYSLMPGLSASSGRDYSWLSSVLLLPANKAPALSVAWTLVHELMFYTVFMLFFISLRWLILGLLGWAVVIVVANVGYALPGGALRYPLSLLNLEFMMGVFAARAVHHHWFRGTIPALWVVGGGLTALALTAVVHAPEALGSARLVLALGLALLITATAYRDQLTPIRWPAWVLLVGNASYSIYLVHNPFLSVSQRVLGRVGMSWPVAMVCGVLAAVLAGLIYYKLVERPAQRFFRNWGKP